MTFSAYQLDGPGIGVTIRRVCSRYAVRENCAASRGVNRMGSPDAEVILLAHVTEHGDVDAGISKIR